MVREIIKNQKYQIEIPIGYNGNKKIRHYETFHGGKKDAKLRENEIKLQIKNNTYVKKNNLTISDLNAEWLESIKSNIAIKTFSTYQLYSKNIINGLGHIKLKNLNVKILEDFYKDLKENTTFAEKTIKHHYTMISAMLNTAVKWGYILTNPNKLVTPIKVHKKEIEFYTPEDVEKLLEVIQKESLKDQAIILLALDSGCRRGELTGLTWDDIDFEKCTININKITQYVAGYGIFEKETKTDTSNRIIYIAPTTIDILKKYRTEQNEKKLRLGNKWENSKRVFTTEFGRDMHPNTPTKVFDRIIKKYNLKKITFHGLRHTSISLQINSGIQTQIISKRAGHSNVTITHKTYSHFFESEFQEVANTMENILNKKSS